VRHSGGLVKTLATILALGFLGVAAASGATAYEALQVIRKSKGDDALAKLVEVRGETGRPQPQAWTILMNDPSARAGIREFVVSGSEILSERAPLRGYSDRTQLPPLAIPRLNLDSDGAFRIADAQAKDKKVGFDSVDYLLRTNDATGAPMWVLRLFDYMGAPVGSLHVSAEDGSVIRSLRLDADARVRPEPVQDFGAGRAPASPADVSADDDDSNGGGLFGAVGRAAKGVGGAVGDTAKGVGNTVKNATLRLAGNVQEILTGERTIDPDSSNDDEQ
jgi:hypothetical protein